MRIGETHYRTIWMEEDPGIVRVIDQRKLPFELKVVMLKSGEDAFNAITEMIVRGAPLIGVTAAYGIYLAGLNSDPEHWCEEVRFAGEKLRSSRPTAVNLTYAVDVMLGQHGVPHTVIVDNAGGHLMQIGEVDLVLVGSDRTTRTGDVVNKIGTYLKALSARDNGIPFYVALPYTSIDFNMNAGSETVIENRTGAEVAFVEGWNEKNLQPEHIRILPESSNVANPGFDITPARLVTGLITERGICNASEEGIRSLFGE